MVIGVINSIVSSRRAEKNEQQTLETRQAQLFMQIYSWWSSKATAEQYGRVRYSYSFRDFQDWNDQVGTGTGNLTNLGVYSDMQSMSEFFEGIGVLVQRGLISVDLVEDLLANRVIWWWEKWKPLSEGARVATGDPKLHDHTEYLYNVMRQRQQKQAPAST